MLSYLRIIIGIILFIFISSLGYSQKNCSGYVYKNCEPFGKPFKLSGQSKDALFELGQKSLFKISVYSDFEYRISLCADKKMKGVFFRIREDNTHKTIIYDSSVEDESFLEKMFSITTTRNLFIEVIVPESDAAKENQSYMDLFGCVGVLIEYNKLLDKGFK